MTCLWEATRYLKRRYLHVLGKTSQFNLRTKTTSCSWDNESGGGHMRNTDTTLAVDAVEEIKHD